MAIALKTFRRNSSSSIVLHTLPAKALQDGAGSLEVVKQGSAVVWTVPV